MLTFDLFIFISDVEVEMADIVNRRLSPNDPLLIVLDCLNFRKEVLAVASELVAVALMEVCKSTQSLIVVS